MGAAASAFGRADLSLDLCLLNAVSGYTNQLALPDKTLFQYTSLLRYNLDIAVYPRAITYPKNIQQVAEIVGCASEYKVPVQARSGGHGYGNHAYGGGERVVVIDMKHLQDFSIDPKTHIAKVGPGNRLIDVNKKLNTWGRSIPHGTCPSVGFGGHATIGGFGPTSRMWGLALDHVEEMKVVLANSTVRTVSNDSYPDLFFALRGAATSFGVVTEFTVKTRPIPQAIRFSYTSRLGSYSSMAATFKTWQRLIADPALSRKIFSQVEINPLGMTISGTYFGSQHEFEMEPFWHSFFRDKVPIADYKHRLQSVLQSRQLISKSVQDYSGDWPGLVKQWAGGPVLGLVRHSSSHFFHKSVTMTNESLISSETIEELFKYFDSSKKGTAIWFVIFDLEGGATNDVAENATAYPHRSALVYLQSYAVQPFGRVSEVTKAFVRGINRIVEYATPPSLLYGGIYPGYVDPELQDPQERYWGVNLDKLQRIKQDVDPTNMFRNPQSIRGIDLGKS